MMLLRILVARLALWAADKAMDVAVRVHPALVASKLNRGRMEGSGLLPRR